ncbi:MAG: DNA polymerase III subunit chi [Gallionella sp.]
MTKIDFYTGCEDKLRTACQLSHKAMQNGVKVLLATPDAATCDTLDKLLWHYPPTAFIPHCRSDASDAEHTQVLLAHDAEKFPHHELLISLHADTPGYFSRFERVIEIVGNDEQDSLRGRARYKFYRDRGYELRHFDLSKKAAA